MDQAKWVAWSLGIWGAVVTALTAALPAFNAMLVFFFGVDWSIEPAWIAALDENMKHHRRRRHHRRRHDVLGTLAGQDTAYTAAAVLEGRGVKTLLLILKVLPIVLKIVQAIERYRLTREATQEVLDALDTNAELMVARAALARASVPADPDSVRSDPFNRDNDDQAKPGSA